VYNWGADLPIIGKLILKKVKDKFFKQFRQSVPDEIAKMPDTGPLVGKPMLMDKFTNMQQKGVNTIVTMKLDSPELSATKIDGPTLSRCFGIFLPREGSWSAAALGRFFDQRDGSPTT